MSPVTMLQAMLYCCKRCQAIREQVDHGLCAACAVEFELVEVTRPVRTALSWPLTIRQHVGWLIVRREPHS